MRHSFTACLRLPHKYTQLPARSLGSSKERGQPAVTTEDSPATYTRQSWIHHKLELCPEHNAEWILALLLTQARGWVAPSIGELGWAKIRMQFVFSARLNSRWLWPVALLQHWDKEVGTLFLPWKQSPYSCLDTSTVEEAGAVHSRITPAESSQESQVEPSFRF